MNNLEYQSIIENHINHMLDTYYISLKHQKLLLDIIISAYYYLHS